MMIEIGLQYERSRTSTVVDCRTNCGRGWRPESGVWGNGILHLLGMEMSIRGRDIRSRMYGKQLNTKGAVWKTIRMANSRVKAHGAKWRKWFNTQRLWRETRRKMFPHQYQENILIHFDAEAGYTISGGLRATLKNIRNDTFRRERVKHQGIQTKA